MKIVIAGGGPAALESAIAARKCDAGAQITICSEENYLPYRRPALSGLLAAGKHPDEKSFYIKPAEFFTANRIDFMPGCKAVAIEGKNLILADKRHIPFDRLILATGSQAVKPPVNGNEYAFTLRNQQDMIRLTGKLDKGIKNAVIIGGGVLGLEIAESLLSRQINTVILEHAPRLFPGRLSDSDADALAARLGSIPQLRLICGCSVLQITPQDVTLADGRSIPAELVIFAAGSRADLSLAATAAVDCGRGVKVNDAMQSSREDIFAAGDTAEFDGRCFNLYMDAVTSGKIAGANAAGCAEKFTAKFSPVRLFALGEKLVMN